MCLLKCIVVLVCENPFAVNLLTSPQLRLLVNTLNANYEYSGNNKENLPLPIHIKLSKNHKLFAPFFSQFWSLHQISNILKRNEPHRSSICEAIHSRRHAYLNA